MTYVYQLWFVREYEDRSDTQLLIGIYASDDDGKNVIVQLKSKPGFSEFPEGFEIHETTLGATGWAEGFATTIGLPPKDAAGEALDVPA